MENLIKKILPVIALIILFGCENVDVVEIDLDNSGKVVVRAELIVGSVFEGVSFSRTIPIGADFDSSKTAVTNAEAYLKIDGAQVIPLHYTGKGIYKPKYDLEFEQGSTVELYAKVDGNSIYSSTIIPFRPSVTYRQRYSNYLQGTIATNPQEAYGAIWVITNVLNNVVDQADDFQTVTASPKYDDEGSITIRTTEIPEDYLVSPYSNQTYIQVYAFDEAYLDFYQSKAKNQLVDDAFAQGGATITWNVYGENVIGLFVGVAVGDILKVN